MSCFRSRQSVQRSGVSDLRYALIYAGSHKRDISRGAVHMHSSRDWRPWWSSEDTQVILASYWTVYGCSCMKTPADFMKTLGTEIQSSYPFPQFHRHFLAMSESTREPPAFLSKHYADHLHPTHSSSSASLRPHITVTWAQSLDAKIAGPGGARVLLSGSESMEMTHWFVLGRNYHT